MLSTTNAGTGCPLLMTHLRLMEALREGYATAEIVTLPIITPDTSFT